MKRYNNEVELMEDNDLLVYKDYIQERICDFLGCEGSCVVKDEEQEPNVILALTLGCDKYEIGITSVEIAEDEYKYYYWLEK